MLRSAYISSAGASAATHTGCCAQHDRTVTAAMRTARRDAHAQRMLDTFTHEALAFLRRKGARAAPRASRAAPCARSHCDDGHAGMGEPLLFQQRVSLTDVKRLKAGFSTNPNAVAECDDVHLISNALLFHMRELRTPVWPSEALSGEAGPRPPPQLPPR